MMSPMKLAGLFLAVTGMAVVAVAQAPAPEQKRESGPLSRVTLVVRTTKAINYRHLSGPTRIDFRGTVLQSQARGEARVESKRGAIRIQAQFEKLEPASRFGQGFLTYVLWAITPEGRADNLGELLLAGQKSKVDVTEQLQAFALIVTAEPYFAVSQPSEVVVMENVVRPDTAGQVEEIDARTQAVMGPLLDDGCVPVVGGFIGATKDGVQTTIGRGGSDYSAALFGAALNAETIEIWTDVDGMMTTDPNICPDAHRIKVISFEEAAELAYFGAKVLHPATVLPAIRKNIPVRVLNSRNPTNEGTLIVARAPHSRATFKAIAAKKGITIVDVSATRMLMAHGFLRQIFEVFDRYRCSVDVVATSEVSVSMTVDSIQALPQITAELQKIADVHFKERNAIVCLVGENIREKPGIAAQVFTALENINVRMISQGASEINITFVIDEADVPEAIRRLHKHFFSAPDPEIFD